MSTSPSKNVFYDLYATSMKSYVNSGYLCDGTGSDELQTGISLDNGVLSIIDKDGNALSSLDLSHISAGGGIGQNAGSSTTGGSITEYTSQTKILQPKTAYLIQGSDFGLTYQQTFISIPEEISKHDEFCAYLDVDFDLQYIYNLCPECVKIDTSKLRDESNNTDVIDLINEILSGIGSGITCELYEDENSEKFFKFTSSVLGNTFVITNLNGHPLYQTVKYPYSPFILKCITIQDVIDAIAEVQPTPFKVVQPIIRLTMRRHSSFLNLKHDPVFNLCKPGDPEYDAFTYDYENLEEIFYHDGEPDPEFDTIPNEEILDKEAKVISLKFRTFADMKKFKMLLEDIHLHPTEDSVEREFELIKRYRQYYEDTKSFKDLKKRTKLEKSGFDNPRCLHRSKLADFDANLYKDTAEDEFQWVSGRLQEAQDQNNSPEFQYQDALYAYPTNPDEPYKIDCSLYFHILSHIEEGIASAGDLTTNAVDYTADYTVYDPSTGEEMTETITYNPEELGEVYGKIIENTGVHALSDCEREETFRMREDPDLCISALKYPNGAFRGISICPVYPEGYVDLVLPLKANIIRDYIDTYSPVDKYTFDKDAFIKEDEPLEKDALTREILYQKLAKKVLCSYNSTNELSKTSAPIAAKALYRCEAVAPSMEMSFRSGITAHELHEQVCTSCKAEKELIDNVKYQWKAAKRRLSTDEWEFENKYAPEYKIVDRHEKPGKRLVAGMSEYISWVDKNNDWIPFKTWLTIFGGVQDDSDIMQLVPSMFIFNPNDIPVKINFLIFS